MPAVQQLQPGGHRPAFAQDEPDPDPAPTRELVSTVTDSKVRATLSDPHAEQIAFNPSEYAEIDARTSNALPHSSQT